MKPSPPGLIALLGTADFVFCDLYEFTLSGGQVLRYTTADVDVVYAGNTYSSALFFDQSGNKATAAWKPGFDVDTWQIYITPVDIDPVTGAANPITIGNTPWLAAVAGGALDGATVDIHRAFWPDWPLPYRFPLNADTTGGLVLVDYFAGRTAAVDLWRNQAIVSINSWMEQFTMLMPKNLWQAPCRHTLFDAGCQLVQAAHAIPLTVGLGSTQSAINVFAGSVIPTLGLGQIVMTSGPNATFRRGILVYDGVTVYLRAPLPFAVTLGETLTGYQGCDKTYSGGNGCAGWANQDNFGGEDLIPAPEAAV